MSAFTDELRERDLYEPAYAICRGLGLRVDELREGYRAPAIVEARARFAQHLRGMGWSYPMIGAILGYKDHTSIMSLLGVSKKHRGCRERREQRFALRLVKP